MYTKLTICQNDASDNGKLVSLIVSETLEEQQDLDKKEKNLNIREPILLHFQREKMKLFFTGRLNFLSQTSFYNRIETRWSVKPGEQNRSHSMVTCRHEISLLMLKKYFTCLLHSFMKYFSTLEEKFKFVSLCGLVIFSI